MADLGFLWYVLNADTSRLSAAKRRLEALKFTAYFPTEIPRPKQDGAASKRKPRPKATMPGYLFVPLHPDWSTRPLYTVPGLRTGERGNVSPFMRDRANGRPATLTNARMKELHKDLLANAISAEALPYAAGSLVRIVAGPFEGLYAEVAQIISRKRVSVFLDMLGQRVRAIVRSRDIEVQEGASTLVK